MPTLLGNQLFPTDNPWNEKITNAPVAANSATLVASIGAASHVHADFGTVWNGSIIGIPYNAVPGTQPLINVVIDAYPDESDLRPAPIPANAVIEGDPPPGGPPVTNNGDRHLLVFDQDHNILYEFFNAHRPTETADHQWHADAEAVWDMNQDSFRTPGFTSADAAGLPILPGLVRPDEVLDQHIITHALRFTVPRTDAAYVFPASHEAGVNNTSLPRMGERFRLKASFDISSYSPANQVILQALKDYGMIVADNGSSWYLSGAPSSRWDDSDLHNLGQLIGSNFEAVDLTPVVSSLSATSGPPTGGTTVTITGLNFSGGAGLTKVFFGTTPATFTINADNSITATAPAHASGTVDVTVQSPYGTSLIVAADRFTYGQAGTLPGVLQWSASKITVGEAAGSLTLTVTRTNGSDGAVTVQYATLNGSATAASDYTATSGTLSFAATQTSATVTVAIADDTLIEGNENFRITLSNATGGATLGSTTTQTVVIHDNDGTQNQRYAAQLYLDLLARPIDAGGLTYWSGLLDQGVPRDRIVLALQATSEYRAVEVQNLYTRVLGRAADASGLAVWTRLLTQGVTADQVEAALIGSDEYFANASGTRSGFVQNVFQLLMNRPADTVALQVWTQLLTQGLSRTTVAAILLGQPEARGVQVQATYNQLLNRPVDSGGLSFWVNALQHGVNSEALVRMLAASDEYFAQLQ